MLKKIMSCLILGLILIPEVNALSYCDGDNLVIEYNKTVRIDGTPVILELEDIYECNFGCQNESYLFLGYPACEESSLLLIFIGIIIIIMFILIMRFLS